MCMLLVLGGDHSHARSEPAEGITELPGIERTGILRSGLRIRQSESL